jgi:hypothetical protein
LLFLVQPMVAKMVLPLLGGTPAVWNTCMVFFQAALLAGYAYAHAAPAWLGVRRQAVLHVLLLLAPLLLLPIAIGSDWVPAGEAAPIPWLLGLLVVTVGIPFFVVSTSAPLLQKWFAGTGHPTAADPYFLYGASNIGSMLALLAYPTIVEPFLPLAAQSRLWQLGYVLLVGLTMICAACLWRWRPDAVNPGTNSDGYPAKSPVDDDTPSISWHARFRWIALAFVPSSLMLGVTTYLTTDIAAIPLLWVIPLAIYLLSFILVFSRRVLLAHERVIAFLPRVVLVLGFLMVGGGTHQMRIGPVMLLHLVVLFVVAMACHGELARLRPPPARLTSFYLCMSIGGVLGGLFNALVAPLAFTTVIEYPLALVLACLLMPGSGASESSGRQRLMDIVLPVGIGLLTAVLVLAVTAGDPHMSRLKTVIPDLPPGLSAVLIYGVPTACCFALVGRPLRFGLGVGAMLVAGALCSDPNGYVLHRERSFFGDLHVRHEPTGEFIQLLHGTTLHGQQPRDPARRDEPSTYFHRDGPIGELFTVLAQMPPRRHVAVTGLGVGTLASYARPGQEWTYYEIDPAVVRVAEDTRYFTYLDDCRGRGVSLRVVLGDARLQLAHAPDGAYDLLILDAFSSDSVPVHLLTREAVRLYLTKLADRGLLVFNISNRYLRLEPVLAAVAHDVGLVGLVQHDQNSDPEETPAPGKTPSSWVVLARSESDLGALAQHPRWQKLTVPAGAAVWTDDFSNLLGALMWR